MNTQSRREFLKCMSSYAALGSGAPVALGLGAMSTAAAQTVTDYKAIVCVFLYGAMDCHNTLVPLDASRYAPYLAQRPDLAIPSASLLEINPLGVVAGRRYGLPPELAPMKTLFDGGTAAMVCNTGPLVMPTTRAQYLARSVTLPPRLFSHNDQQALAMSSSPEGPGFGWGGRLADLMMSQNSLQALSCVSASGNAVYLTGRNARQYQVGVDGPVEMLPITNSRTLGSLDLPELLRGVVERNRGNLFERDHAAVTRNALEVEAALSAALIASPALPLPVGSEQNPLAQQLRVVARIIAARTALSQKRQVFFVSLGGFDTHNDQNAELPPLQGLVANAIKYFHDAMGTIGVAQKVTLFTASDFGRALVGNVGGGSDHGWGGHHFVVGGAVRGNRLYGSYPNLAVGSATDAGNNRLIPTTSLSQLGATLGKWFGVPDSTLLDIFPGLSNFTLRDLGFFPAT